MPDTNFSAMKKRAVSCACTPCRELQKKCDGFIPCGRCVSAKREEKCVLAPQQKRGRKGKAGEHAGGQQDDALLSTETLFAGNNVGTTNFLLSLILSNCSSLVRNPQFRPADLLKCFEVDLGSDFVTIDLNGVDFNSFLPSVYNCSVVAQSFSGYGSTLFGVVTGLRILDFFAEKHSEEESTRVFGAMLKSSRGRAHVKRCAFPHTKTFAGSASGSVICKSTSHVLFDESGAPRLMFASVYDFFAGDLFPEIDFQLDTDMFEVFYS